MRLFKVWASRLLLASAVLVLALEAADCAKLDSSGRRAYNQTNRSKSATSRPRIAGLYSELDHILPIQGAHHLYEELRRDGNDLAEEKTFGPLLLTQYYLATCPDCQGFSPYFKRFVGDIWAHWHRLIRVLAVNCNDDQNINLCWRENPNTLVPLVRWYAFGVLYNNYKELEFPKDLLSVGHRNYIEKDRRDLISLRHATLKFITSQIDALSRIENEQAKDVYRNVIPLYVKTFVQLGKTITYGCRGVGTRSCNVSSLSAFLDDLKSRIQICRDKADLSRNNVVRNFIVFEHRDSYSGRTLMADWSNWTCPGGLSRDFPIIVHYTTDFAVLHQLDLKLDRESVKELVGHQPVLILAESFNETTKFKFLATNSTDSGSRYELLRPKRDSLLEDQLAESIDRSNNLQHRQRVHWYPARLRRSSNSETASNDAEVQRLVDAENINWAPWMLHVGVESLRRHFNRIVAIELFGQNYTDKVAHLPGLDDADLGPIKSNPTPETPRAVDLTADDSSHTTMTDYYKALSDIVNKALVSKAEIDGYQLMASACFVQKLAAHFPFQGAAEANSTSKSRHYLEILHRELMGKLRALTRVEELSCGRSLSGRTLDGALSKVNMTSAQLDEIKANISSRYAIGLPDATQLKYSYCRGSSDYLRGYTCSLWVLFHTMTVSEFIEDIRFNKSLQATYLCDDEGIDVDQEASRPHGHATSEDLYQFQINYQNTTDKCDPENPEKAFLGANSSQLFVNAPKLVAANIVNFVRFYLSCTNCAAHFSCMVSNSRLDLSENSRANGDHLLWLWEAHNRVNLRTRNTHSEDPAHPKHVFPTPGACRQCYLEKPDERAEIKTLEQLKFNRRELIKFLVARYQRESISNNKIGIENLYKA